jgi:hypothetical protein
MSPPATPGVDATAIRRLLGELGREGFREALQDFCTGSAQDWQAILDALEENRGDEAARRARGLAVRCRRFGLERVAGRCVRLALAIDSGGVAHGSELADLQAELQLDSRALRALAGVQR